MHGYNFLHGYDLNENGNFNENKLVMHGYKTLHRGDLNENGNCKDGKLVMHDYKIYIFVWGANLPKNGKFRGWKLFILSFGIERSTQFSRMMKIWVY